MKEYREMTSQELTALREELRQEYSEIQTRGLSLNMARGKPDAEQLALSDAMWTIADASTPMERTAWITATMACCSAPGKPAA